MVRPSSPIPRTPPLALAFSMLLLALPGAVLALAAVRYHSALLTVGMVSVFLAAMLLVRNRLVWRPPLSALVILIYMIALGWLWFATRDRNDEFARFGRGLLIAVSMALFVCHDLTRTGVEPRRKARVWCNRIYARTRWPQRLAEIADLPEVQGLRQAVRDDPTLVFELLEDRRAEVQAAGLAAIQGRRYWRLEEGAVVLKVARNASNPEVRCLAATALTTANHVELINGLATLLRDGRREVREAAGIALITGGDRRWAQIRTAFREVLSDPAFAQDRALPGTTGRLSPLAVCDLTGWVAESTTLSERALQTLVSHYAAILESGTQPHLVSELTGQITDQNTLPVLRIELANMLRHYGCLTQDVLDRMTDPDQPSALRLQAVEILMSLDPTDSAALDVLKGLGRQPNRDTAVAIARILQHHLKMDFGLPQPGVPLGIKQAADITQRVVRWATTKSPSAGVGVLEETPPPLGDPPRSPAPAAAFRPGAANSVPGLSSRRRRV